MKGRIGQGSSSLLPESFVRWDFGTALSTRVTAETARGLTEVQLSPPACARALTPA